MRRIVGPGSDALWPLVTIALFALLLIAPLWETPGLPNSADGTLHLHRAAAVTRAFDAGLFWPRWFPELYGGLGAPTFHYYSPLFYWLTALLHSGGLALDSAVRLLLSGLFLLAGLAAYGWLRRLLGQLPGLMGSLLLLSQPHIFREFYFQGDYPQLTAILLLPICLWSFTALAQENRRRYWLLAPLSLALLVLAHNLTAMIGAAFLFLYWLLLALSGNADDADFRRFNPLILSIRALFTHQKGGFLRGATAALTAALLSAFFWLPALGDVGLVQVQNLQRDFFSYRQYFLSWEELFAPILPFDQRAANPPFPHALGWPLWLALLAGGGGALFTFFRAVEKVNAHRRHGTPINAASVGENLRFLRNLRSVRFWGLSGATLAFGFLLLTLPLSAPLWERLPGLDLLQFPSRLLSLSGLGAALAGAAALAALPDNWRRWTALLFTLAIALSTAVFLFPRHPFLPFPSISPTDTVRVEETDSLWGMTSGNEFLPRWADPTSSTAPAAQRLPSPITLTWQTPHRATVQAGEATGQALLLPIHYFPAWQVEADNAPLSISPDREGRLLVDGLKSGQALTLRWIGTEWQRRGEIVSLLGLIVWLVIYALWSTIKDENRNADCADDADLRRLHLCSSSPVYTQRRRAGMDWAGPALALLLLGLWLGRMAIVGSGVGWWQPYSPPGRVLGVEHPLAVTLGDGQTGQLQLLGWDALYRGSVRPGDTLRLRLYWQSLGDLSEPLRSFLHLYSPERKHSWAIVQNQNPGRIPTTSWLPALYYVDELALTIPTDQPPGAFTLAVGLVTEGGERLAVAEGRDGLVELGQVEISPLVAGRSQPLAAEVAAQARVGDSLKLQGYDLLPAPGGPILRTWWTPTGPVPPGLTLFVHLLSPDGERLAQWDGPPLDGLLPTDGWQPGRLYIDRRPLPLPEALASGPYTILVGLYQPENGQRLPFTPNLGPAELFRPDSLAIPFRVP